MEASTVFEGRSWKLGDNVPTDAIIPTEALLRDGESIGKRVLASLRPEFPASVRPGDVICAGRNFGCSSGRAVAPKALLSVGVGAVVAESFARTFYRNAYEVGLPILELPGISDLVTDGDRLRIDLERALVENLENGRTLEGPPPDPFLLSMLRAGGIIPLVKREPQRFRRRGRLGR